MRTLACCKFLLVCSLLALCGCTTVYYVDQPANGDDNNFENITVYVTNPENEAFSVLKNSHIYVFSEDQNWPVKLTIGKIEKIGPYCGLGSLASISSLGTIPNSAKQAYNIYYTLSENGINTTYWHRISYTQSTSIWNGIALPFTKTEDEAKAVSLAHSSREECDIKSCK